MLKIDIHGMNCANQNKLEPLQSPDERAEWEFTRVIARRMVLQHHNIMLRMDDVGPQERADFLLDGRLDELSLYLRMEYKPSVKSTDEEGNLVDKAPSAGYELRIPGGDHEYDVLFAEMVKKWLDLIPDLTYYMPTKKPLLMPPRAPDLHRPARLEIAFQFFQANDWDYWCSPVMLRTIAQHLSRAINEFDDRFNEVKLHGLSDNLQEKRQTMMEMFAPEESEIQNDAKPKGKLKVFRKN